LIKCCRWKTYKKEWLKAELNCRPWAYESPALTTELLSQKTCDYYYATTSGIFRRKIQKIHSEYPAKRDDSVRLEKAISIQPTLPIVYGHQAGIRQSRRQYSPYPPQ
jgi:hypothetical protein